MEMNLQKMLTLVKFTVFIQCWQAPPGVVGKQVLEQQNRGLFNLKIARELARAFLVWATLTDSPPVFLNGGSNSKHDVESTFCHFGRLLFLIALMIQLF
jgi:hypothetical protein